MSAIDLDRRRRVNERNGERRRWNDGGLDRCPYARARFHHERRQFVARVSDRIHCGAGRGRLRIAGMLVMGRLFVAVSGPLMMGGNTLREGVAPVDAAERPADLARHGSSENNERQHEGQKASRHLNSSISNQRQKYTGFL